MFIPKTTRVAGFDANRVGLGCMGLTEFYGSVDEKTAIETLDAAVDIGVNFFDTADFYGNGDNEILLNKALSKHRSKVLIATKFGIVRSKEILPDGSFRRLINGAPEYARQCCEASLKRLGTDCIDLFYVHRVDPVIPIEETIGELSKLVSEGKIKHIGLSEANSEIILRAHKVHPIAAVQTEYSLWSRDVESAVLPLCSQLGITFVAYSPLGRGLVLDRENKNIELEEGDFRKTLPRFSKENFDDNRNLMQELARLAQELKMSSAQLSLAWLLSKQDNIIAIPGTSKVKHLRDNFQALETKFLAENRALLEEIFDPKNISGNRYNS